MKLSRWEPLRSTEDIFSHLAPEFFGRWPRMRLPAALEAKLEWTPSTNVSETDAEYVIRADLPAVTREDIKVSVHDGVITIEGERRQHEDQQSEKVHRVESLWGSFSRSFTLPFKADNALGVLLKHQNEKPQPPPLDLLAFPPQGDLSHYPNSVATILVGEFLV